MPRDANGLYTLPLPAVAPGTTITSLWGNTTTDDLAASMTNSLSRNGEGGMLAPLRLIDGTVASPAWGFSNEVGLGMYRNAAGNMRIAIAGNDVVRYTSTNQMEVFRAGVWYPVQALPGYASSGLHTEYTGDLDDIVRNSNYYALAANVTNNPPALTGSMQIETDFWSTDTDQAVQVATGMDTDTASLSFIRVRQAGAWEAWLPFSSGGTISPTPPSAPQPASKWWDSNTGRAYIYYDDGTSSQWVEEDPPISDGSIAISEQVFDQKLDGYGVDGFHEDYAADLNDLADNSVFTFDATAVTNAPAEMTSGRGVIYTDVTDDQIARIQVIYATAPADVTEPRQFQRTFTGTWSAWVMVVVGGAFTERLDGYLDDGLHELNAIDLNTITVNSVYGTFQNPNQPPDMGTNDSGFVTTYNFNADSATQTMLGMNNQSQYKLWQRQKDGGVWDAWKLVVNGGIIRGLVTTTGTITAGIGFAVTKGGVGRYQIDFDQAFPDSNYVVLTTGARDINCSANQNEKSTTECVIETQAISTHALIDAEFQFSIQDI